VHQSTQAETPARHRSFIENRIESPEFIIACTIARFRCPSNKLLSTFAGAPYFFSIFKLIFSFHKPSCFAAPADLRELYWVKRLPATSGKASMSPEIYQDLSDSCRSHNERERLAVHSQICSLCTCTAITRRQVDSACKA
jgi:hypothetical protein